MSGNQIIVPHRLPDRYQHNNIYHNFVSIDKRENMQSRNGNASPVIAKLPYYFGNLTTMEKVVKVLYEYIDHDGAFILRNSLSGNGLTLSLVHERTIKHIKLKEQDGDYYLSHPKFESLKNLIRYYRKNDVPNVEMIKRVRLIQPITLDAVGINSGNKMSIPSLPTSYKAETGHRPPALPPTQTPPPGTKCQNPYYFIYTEPRLLTQNLTPMLIDQLKEMEKCECGLYIQDAMLPGEWAMHLTGENDEEGNPRVFFVSPDENSSWSLPAEIIASLLPHHIDILNKYKVNLGQ